jgi:hypothetical protein
MMREVGLGKVSNGNEGRSSGTKKPSTNVITPTKVNTQKKRGSGDTRAQVILMGAETALRGERQLAGFRGQRQLQSELLRDDAVYVGDSDAQKQV